MVFLVSCSQSSGSGSESGTHQTQKSVKSKNIIKSDNDSGHSGENENGSIGLNASDGSSDGSGAQVRKNAQRFLVYSEVLLCKRSGFDFDISFLQSSWTKKAVGVGDSPRAVSLWDRADSTCAQVVHSNPEFPNNHLVAAPAEKETQEQDEKIGKERKL